MTEFEIVAAEQSASKLAGVSIFVSSVPCQHGHIGRRFTADRTCCECNAISCRARYIKRKGPEWFAAQAEKVLRAASAKASRAEVSRKYTERGKLRAAAIASGEMIYQSLKPCPKNHIAGRYRNGNCVTCSKEDSAAKTESAYYKRHYAANSERILQAAKERYPQHREKRVEGVKEWLRKNPEKRKAISANYTARRRSQVEQGIDGGTLAAWTKSQPKTCFYCGCGCAETFHVDHFMPLAKGGAHVLTNLRIACAPCNQRKSAKLPDVWIDELERVAA